LGVGPRAPPRSGVFVLRRQLEQMGFAETIPVILSFAVDGAGRIRIARQVRIASGEDPIDIVTAAGDYVGTLRGQRVPSAFSASGRVAHIDFGELGDARVRVAQLQESWR
jgi:hypothetical protein